MWCDSASALKMLRLHKWTEKASTAYDYYSMYGMTLLRISFDAHAFCARNVVGVCCLFSYSWVILKLDRL